MIERVCPHCDAGNSNDQKFCGQCGTAFDQPLARRAAAPLAQRANALPVQWKQAGKVVALGVATIAAEVGLALLQRRQGQTTSLALRQPQPRSTARVVAVGRRVSESWYGGELHRRVEEQVMWLMPDAPRE